MSSDQETPDDLLRELLKVESAKQSAKPVVKDQWTDQLESIDGSITARHVVGKFQGPVILHGQQIHPAGYNADRWRDYNLLVDAKQQLQFDPTGQIRVLGSLVGEEVHSLLRGNPSRNHISTLASCHILSYYELPNQNEALVGLLYPYDFVDAAMRNAKLFTVFLRMPKAKLGELLSTITNHPDALEQFYHVAAAGLESSVSRFKTEQIAVVNLDTLMPLNKFTPPNPSIGLFQMVNARKQSLNSNGIQHLRYSQAVGEKIWPVVQR